jgi:AAA domain-containing protein
MSDELLEPFSMAALVEAGDTGDMRDTPSRVPRRTRWTAVELLAEQFPEPRWSIPGLIPEGLTLFVGAPKVGKSWLQLGLGIAVASGGRALGRLPVEQGDVLYLALEDHPRRLQERLRKMLNGGEPPKRLTIELACPPLPLGGRTLIGEWITDHPAARLVMIDVLARVRGVPANGIPTYDADYLAVAAAKELADEHGIAVVVTPPRPQGQGRRRLAGRRIGNPRAGRRRRHHRGAVPDPREGGRPPPDHRPRRR